MNAAFKNNLLKFDLKEPQCRKLHRDYLNTRRVTESLCKPLSAEDYTIQSMPDVSPPKWHLAHTAWFFETFILAKVFYNYRHFNPSFNYLFNSYYKGVGAHYPRTQRGLLSKPNTVEVYNYRHFVDAHIEIFFNEATELEWKEFGKVLEMGIHHEQQHQELLMMDILHNFHSNPLKPHYLEQRHSKSTHIAPALTWFDYSEDLYEIGTNSEDFSYDNERPRHRTFIEDFRLASRLVTNAEYLKFVEDSAYHHPLLWLSDAWDHIQKKNWKAPLYWENRDGEWWQMTLRGSQKLDLEAPVCHLSFYEAEAYARWAGKRLPRESEWEVVAQDTNPEGNFLESRTFKTQVSPEQSLSSPAQLWGDAWEWTQSSYSPYPRFKALTGDLGEYNGKFMSNQMVLRGGSCVTPETHIRASYRNFFPPWSRWQFSGIRLAEDL